MLLPVLKKRSLLEDLMCPPQDLNLPLLLENKSITKVMSHHNLAMEVLGLLREKGTIFQGAAGSSQLVLWGNQKNIYETEFRKNLQLAKGEFINTR